MTQKAGQKCTAIRRAYVPDGAVAGAVEALSERLRAVKVGDSSREEVGMGPLATARQLRDAREGVAELARAAEVAFGSPDRVDALGTGGKGFFMGPVLLVSRSPAAGDAVHAREVFGPVATVIGYDGSAAQAAERVAWGGGGLVASLYSDDRAFLDAAVLGVAPHSGRIVIGSSRVAGQAIPPGTVLPQLVHGGPGRAGPGEELGAMRGLALYMQRTALQGDRALVERLAGRR